VRRLGTRLARVEEQERVRLAELRSGPAMLLVYPDDWPSDDLAAFDGGDPVMRADAVARHTGARPGPGTKLIAIRVRSDGPA
jgi:hypothetical protein